MKSEVRELLDCPGVLSDSQVELTPSRNSLAANELCPFIHLVEFKTSLLCADLPSCRVVTITVGVMVIPK